MQIQDTLSLLEAEVEKPFFKWGIKPQIIVTDSSIGESFKQERSPFC